LIGLVGGDIFLICMTKIFNTSFGLAAGGVSISVYYTHIHQFDIALAVPDVYWHQH
jgi:hypothetical protein